MAGNFITLRVKDKRVQERQFSNKENREESASVRL